MSAEPYGIWPASAALGDSSSVVHAYAVPRTEAGPPDGSHLGRGRVGSDVAVRAVGFAGGGECNISRFAKVARAMQSEPARPLLCATFPVR